MLKFQSLSDPNHKLDIDEENYTVGIFRNPKGKDPEHVFLLVEGVNAFGKIMLKRYDCIPDPADKTKTKILIEPQLADPVNIKEKFSDILNNEPTTGKVWSITANKAAQLHQNILNSQRQPGMYNPLGDTALIPMTGDCVRAMPQGVKDAAKAGTYATTEAISGQKASTKFKAMIIILNSIPNTIFEPVTERGYQFLSQRFGQNVCDVAENAFKSPGDNSFTWARTMLISLDKDVINEELPRQALDLVSSIASYHLPFSDQDKRQELENTKLKLSSP